MYGTPRQVSQKNHQRLAERHTTDIGKFVLQSTIELRFRNVMMCPDF